MTTLTVQITGGRRWYGRKIGKTFEVVNNDENYFSVIGYPKLKIHKNHAIVTAVHYDDAEPPVTNGAAE